MSPRLFPASEAPATPFVTAHCDGGARGNPGPAGYGVEITSPTGEVLAELSEFLGFCTNNVAEYSGLLASLQYALDHGHRALRVVSDSELMVKQIQGKYKVNSPDLKLLWTEAKARIARLDRFEITHALRHKNKAADRLANEAMDRGMRRVTLPEGKPLVRAAGLPTADTQTAVESLPLRATPYPSRAEAPPTPRSFDPRASQLAKTDVNPGLTQPKQQISTPKLGTSDPKSAPAAPAMLRGFTRDGVVHILGPHTLPDGRFVKIIPE